MEPNHLEEEIVDGESGGFYGVGGFLQSLHIEALAILNFKSVVELLLRLLLLVNTIDGFQPLINETSNLAHKILNIRKYTTNWFTQHSNSLDKYNRQVFHRSKKIILTKLIIMKYLSFLSIIEILWCVYGKNY